VSHSRDEEQYGVYVDRIARGFGISSSGKMLGRGIAYATQIMLARMYGPTQLGFYTLGYIIVSLANILAQLGMENAVVRYVAQYEAERDVARTRGVILLTLGTSFVVSLALSGLLFLGAGFLAIHVFHEPYLEIVFRVFSLAVPPFTVMSMACYATVGFQTVKPQTYAYEIGQPLINFVLIIPFYFLGAQLLGAIAAYIISYVAALALAFYYLKQIFPRLFDRNTPAKFESRELFTTSSPMLLAISAEYIHNAAPVLVLGIFTAGATVGVYNVAARTAWLGGILYIAFSSIFSPIITNLYRRGQLDDLRYLYKDVSRWIFTITLVVLLLAMLLSKDILALFGEDFVTGWSVLVIIAGAQLFTCSIGVTNHVLIMTGQQKIWMVATIASALTGLIGSAVLIPTYGMLGAAWATASSLVLGSAISLAGVYRVMNFWPYSYLYLKSLVAALLAGGAVLLVRSALTLPEGIVAIFVLTSLYIVTIVFILLVLGLSPSDRQFFKAIATAVWRRMVY
jgi:O-antigen/teichoic acid export membrane protein